VSHITVSFHKFATNIEGHLKSLHHRATSGESKLEFELVSSLDERFNSYVRGTRRGSESIVARLVVSSEDFQHTC
jgi:hypothetical protein